MERTRSHKINENNAKNICSKRWASLSFYNLDMEYFATFLSCILFVHMAPSIPTLPPFQFWLTKHEYFGIAIKCIFTLLLVHLTLIYILQILWTLGVQLHVKIFRNHVSFLVSRKLSLKCYSNSAVAKHDAMKGSYSLLGTQRALSQNI